MPPILLVTVTKTEAQAVLQAFSDAAGQPWERRIIGDKTYYALGQVGGADIFMVQSEQGTATPGGALLTVRQAIEAVKPLAVILVGCAFGTKPGEQAIGNILISTQITVYDPQKVTTDGSIPLGVRVNSSIPLLDKFRSGDLDWRGVQVHFGLLLSGEKLVTTPHFRNQLLKVEPEAIGGEMEGAGLYTAASQVKVDWIIIKAISNWADGNNDEQAKQTAADNAVAFVLHVFQQGGLGVREVGQCFNVPDLPPHFLTRPDDLASIKVALLGENGKVGITAHGKVGMQGMGGIGKSVLAAALAHDDDVRKAFPNGIIWLTLGQEPQIVNRQIQLAEALGYTDSNYRDEQQGKASLRMLLANKTCLVILDDVWQLAHAHAFNCLGLNARLLLTTRNQEIVRDIGAYPYPLDVLSDDQALALLSDWAGQPVGNLPPEARLIADECGNLPLALAMVGAIVQRNPESWGAVLRRLQNADIDRIRQEFPDYPYPNLLRAIQVSVDALPRQPVDLHSCYLALAVFPEGVPIPEATLRNYWGLDELDTAEVIESLTDRSLARLGTQRRLSIHSLQRHYLRKQAGELAPFHHHLLKTYASLIASQHPESIQNLLLTDPPISPPWFLGPNDGYFFQYLVYHFLQLNDWPGLYSLLTDFDFLESKCRAVSVYDLETDFRQVLMAWQGDPEWMNVLLAFEERLRLESHHISKAPELLFPQLYNHLTWLDAEEHGPIYQVCETARKSKGGWLRSQLDPRPARPTWLCSLEGHTEGVNAVAVTPDGGRVMTGSDDCTVKVWELTSGRLMRSLEGHTGRVNSVAVTPDGTQVVTGSSDRTVKVWELASGRLLRSLEGHTGRVNSVAVTSDGMQVVTGSSDHTVKVWELASGRLLHSLEGHTGGVNAVAVTPDGKRVATGSFDNTVKVWELASGRLLRSLEGHTGPVKAVAVTPNGVHVVTGASDRMVKVWELASGRLLHSLEGHTGGVNAVAVTPDGRQVATGSFDNTVKVWELANGRLLHSFKKHTGGVNAVAVMPDGRQVVTGSDDCMVKVWELASGRLLRSLEGHTGSIKAVAVTPNGSQVVTGSDDCTVKVWELASGRLLRSLKGHADRVNSVAVTPDGRQVVTGSSDRTVKVWDLASGRLLRSLKKQKGDVNSVMVTPDGRRVVTGSDDHTVKVWELASGRLLHSLTEHSRGVNAVAVTPDGRRIVAGSDDCTVKVWELASGRLLGSLEGHTDRVNSVAVTPDGRQVVTGSSDHTVKVWELASGRLLHSLEGHTDRVNSVAVTPDGKRVITGASDRTVKIWDTFDVQAGGHLLHSLEGHVKPVKAVAVTPDGMQMITGSVDRTVKVWMMETACLTRSLEGHTDRVMTVAMTLDGCQVVTGSDDCMVKVWELASGRLLRSLEGHTGSVKAVAVTPDGRQVVTGSEDCTVKVWELASGRLLHSLEGHTDRVNSVAVTPDGKWVITGASDRTVKIWDTFDVQAGGHLLHSLEGHTDRVRTVAVTPDGRQVVTGSDDCTVKIWELASGRLLRSLEGHIKPVRTVAVTTDGTQVVTGSDDCTVKVWELASGRLLRSLEGHIKPVRTVAVTTDGTQVVTGSDDHTIKHWQISPEEEATCNKVLFSNDSPIICLALSPDCHWLTCGDLRGRIWIFEWIH